MARERRGAQRPYRPPAAGRVVALPLAGHRSQPEPGGQPALRPGRRGNPEPYPLASRLPRRRRGRRWLLGLSLLALASLAVVFYLAARDVARELPGRVAQPVRRGTLELAVTGEALLLRNEWVQVAPRAGALERVVPEGQAVRTGTKVATVDGQALRAEHPGTLSYQVDGLEAELAPTSLPWLTGTQAAGPGPEWLLQLPLRRVEPPGRQVAAGQPIFKVVDNAGLWVVLTGDAEPLSGVKPGDPARVEFPALGSADYRFAVAYKSEPRDGRVLLALAADSPVPDTLAFLRRTPIRVVLGRWEGWVVPRSALTVSGGRLGVLVRSAGGERFVPVKVLGQTEKEAAVDGELRPGDAVVVPAAGAGG